MVTCIRCRFNEWLGVVLGVVLELLVVRVDQLGVDDLRVLAYQSRNSVAVPRIFLEFLFLNPLKKRPIALL